MNDRTEQMDDLQLVALPSAVGCTEMFVRFSLTEWALRPMREAASEVARAMAEAVVAAADPAGPGMMIARVRLSGGDLIMEIESPREVRAPAAPPGGHTGVVDLGAGRCLLWASLPLPGGMEASAVPLPRRQRRPSQAAAIEAAREPVDTDPDVMQRILYGLASRHDRHQR
ncbi:ATP-binding protein [Actinokineospora iranica]|uniref:Uncharacterized protein n=1 Tax=Actinokineospora iranica TaxID=1271860 RepID=A0A1G6LFK7_9PSEU|nr:ATP-binding protein [Actinokineospora iranica]SDC42030.1 hypothetical protein SAMN05216174_10247 [Actinokineospora iranica]